MSASLSSPLVGSQPDQAVELNRGNRVPLLKQYLRIVRRRKGVLVGATLGCLILGLIFTLLMTPKFTASSTIEISRDSDRVTQFEGVERETSVADQEFYQTQYGLLRARSLAERVAVQLRLVDDPNFFNLFDEVRDTPAFNLSGGRYAASGRAERLRIAGEILLDNLAVAPTRQSRLVDIQFTSPNAEFSANVANAWAENFIQTNLERKVQATSYGRTQIQRQLVDAKERLDASQRQLVAYASRERIINLPAEAGGDGSVTQERSIVAEDLSSMNRALADATADRIRAEARANQEGRSGGSNEALSNPAINTLRQRRAESEAQYEQLMVQFEPSYPPAQALRSQIDQYDEAIAREESRVSGALQGQFRAMQARERVLQAKVDQLKDAYLDLRRRSIQYNIYQQEVDTNRALYDALLQRFKEIGVAGGIGVNNIAIVDRADVPQKTSSPRLMLNLLLSLLLGLALGAALALALEQIDEAISDPEEIERRLNLPLLGSVPMIEKVSPRDALLDPKSELVEAYLAIQTTLSFTTEHGVPRSFSVTSTRPGEGKSTTALALAATLARAQKKVILIDGDMRSPSVHHLGQVGHARGLSNFLAGEDDIDALLFDMSDFGFIGMSAGPIPPNAADLLNSNRLALLIERLQKRFDHVVIDSPPVMGLADAPLIAKHVEGIIYAIESHGIRSAMVETALGRLTGSNVRILGAVLTKFDSRKAYNGYGYDYGYGYGRDGSSQQVS